MKTGLMVATAMTLGLTGAASAQHRHQSQDDWNRVWVPDRYEYRERQIVIPAEHRTIHREVWVEPQYEWVTRKVWVPDHRAAGNRFRLNLGDFAFGINLAGHQSCGGYYRTTREQVLVREGHYDTISEVVCVRAERVETVRERVLVEPGHWEVIPTHRGRGHWSEGRRHRS